jgi:hypothetical protein
MNNILDNLYIVRRAYCRPEDVATVLTDIASRLDLWYWTLPMNMRFPRHPSAFALAPYSMSNVMVGRVCNCQGGICLTLLRTN